ncbi:MAG: hypothetical protein HQK89_00760 [Nitrospirae bacterium]|nr:hypothetical protein [Nitrospirota bacterium]
MKVADMDVDELETFIRRVVDDYLDEQLDADEAIARMNDKESKYFTAEEVKKRLVL